LTDLQLYDGNQLSGSIPAAIGNLSGLVSLSLANNQLSGAIPSEVGGLSALRRLLLQGNQLTGEIPAALWTITGLSDVRLSDNQLSGTLAPEIGSRPGLLYLYLDNNQLSGAIPTEMAGASRLLHIRLDHNELSGAIPAELGGLRWLKYLRLDHNRFSGSIPQSIMELHEMEDIIKAPVPTYPPPEIPDDDAHFQIQANKFTFADFPLSGTTSIVYAPQDSVDVSVSQAVGIGELLILLADIDRGTTPACKYQWYKDGVPLTDAPTEDGYTDTITVSGAADGGSYHYTITHDRLPALTLTSRLQEVTLTVPPIQREALIALYNATDGDNWTNIPEDKKWKQDGAFTDDISNWYGIILDENQAVVELNLYNKRVKGDLPQEIGALIDLKLLDLGSNDITSIPPEIGNMISLEKMDLWGSELSETLPPEIGNLTNLVWLKLDHNDLTSIPPEIGNLTNLEYMNMASNMLEGSIPAEIGNLVNLKYLDFFNNRLSEFPLNIGSLSNLEELDLGFNQFRGSIPSEIGQLTQLRRLEISGPFTGNIPSEIGNLVELEKLTLSCANSRGPIPVIPTELRFLSRLNHLHLGHFQGSIPQEIWSIKTLTLLHISGREITGEIPAEIEQLTNLETLIFSITSLEGSIPSEIGRLSKLFMLNIDRSKLISGEIPSEIGNLHNLEYLQCYDNSLSGRIPPEIGQMSKLKSIILRNNELSGSIPPEIGSLSALTYLSLWGNQLTSLDVSANTALTNLDCSSNQLTSLNVANGNNTNIWRLRANDNPNLSCIQVDDQAYSEANWTGGNFVFDPQSEFSEDCIALLYVNIPDSNFEQALIDLGIDSNPVIDGKVLRSDVESVTSLNVSDKNIADLTGIEAFTALEQLYCLRNQLTSLDISANTALETLYCYDNQLTNIDLSNNTLLNHFRCYDNQLTSLDVSNNVLLERLYCPRNQLTSLDFRSNINLLYLNCTENQITNLDVSANTALTSLYCYENQLTSLNVANGNNTNFLALKAENNPNLTCIQVDDVAYSNANWTGDDFTFDPQHTFSEDCNYVNIPDSNFEQALIDLGIDSNPVIDGRVLRSDVENVTSLNVSNKSISDLTGIEAFTSLETLYCYSNQLTSLDVSSNTALKSLACLSNQLTSLDVSSNTALTNLSCGQNQLTSLDVSNNTALTSLSCFSNQLTSLDVSSNTALTNLSCGDNQLTSLDVSNNTALRSLSCRSNQLSSLDVSSNTALTALLCYDNQLTSLDLSSNTALYYLYCYENQLTSLNVANGNNTNFTTLRAQNNPDLTCIQVDDVSYSEANWTGVNFVFDPQTSFSEDCGYTLIPDANFEQALIDLGYDTAPIDGKVLTANIENVTQLFLGSPTPTSLYDISDLTGIEDFTALQTLWCNVNQLTSLDVSQNTALKTLNCGDNQLTSLDLSSNTLLEQLFCDENQLTSLNVANGNNTNLIHFRANNNPNLTCIQVDDVAYSEANWTGVYFVFDPQASFSEDCAPIQQSQIEALIAFYNSTDGDHWTNIPEEKKWKQESQSGHEARNWEGITIDENGKVVQIDLQDKGLRGTVPEEISALSSLRVLDLSHNMLQGEVPVCLARMDNLEELYLNNNEFEGYMDLEFSVMPNIRVMALQHNDLVSIPDFSFNDYVDPAQVHLHAENNRLEFYYIENNLNGDGSDLLGAFTYMPQKVYGEPGTLGFVEGRELSLGMRMLGRANHYQWQLSSDNGGSWTDLEGDAPEYAKSSAAQGDEGWYRVKITNDRVHGDDDEILSAILKVQVATAPVLVNYPLN
jgi:Leucine-rich repeat (LRR) protein